MSLHWLSFVISIAINGNLGCNCEIFSTLDLEYDLSTNNMYNYVPFDGVVTTTLI